jgi:hypothetical protein
MPAGTSRSAARLAVTVLFVLLVSGCASDTASSTDTSPSGTTTTVASTTAATVPPMTTQELAWLAAVTKLQKKIDKPFTVEGDVYLTRAKMTSYAKALRSCSRELARIGSPGDRLQPVYTLVKKACRTYDKGAKCFATAARVSMADGGVIAGSPQERTQSRALDCGGAAQGNGSNLLADAKAKGEEIKAQAGH